MTEPTQDIIDKAKCYDWLLAHPEVFKEGQFTGDAMTVAILDLIEAEGGGK